MPGSIVYLALRGRDRDSIIPGRVRRAAKQLVDAVCRRRTLFYPDAESGGGSTQPKADSPKTMPKSPHGIQLWHRGEAAQVRASALRTITFSPFAVCDHLCGTYEAALDDVIARMQGSPPLEGVRAVIAADALHSEWSGMGQDSAGEAEDERSAGSDAEGVEPAEEEEDTPGSRTRLEGSTRTGTGSGLGWSWISGWAQLGPSSSQGPGRDRLDGYVLSAAAGAAALVLAGGILWASLALSRL